MMLIERCAEEGQKVCLSWTLSVDWEFSDELILLNILAVCHIWPVLLWKLMWESRKWEIGNIKMRMLYDEREMMMLSLGFVWMRTWNIKCTQFSTLGQPRIVWLRTFTSLVVNWHYKALFWNWDLELNKHKHVGQQKCLGWLITCG